MFVNRVFRERALQRRARQEPLDDRLQITAPREWFMVAGLCVMVLVLAAVSVFGRVERTLSLDAALVPPGERAYLVAPESGDVEDTATTSRSDVVAFISPADAAILSAGMEARVGFGGPGDGGRRIFEARVEEVSARPGTPPEWLADEGLAIPREAHLLRVALIGEEPDALVVDGGVVSLRVLLGRESLVSFLWPGSGG